jgi:hypothetical protein
MAWAGAFAVAKAEPWAWHKDPADQQDLEQLRLLMRGGKDDLGSSRYTLQRVQTCAANPTARSTRHIADTWRS